jgi:hypothetical protein
VLNNPGCRAITGIPWPPIVNLPIDEPAADGEATHSVTPALSR